MKLVSQLVVLALATGCAASLRDGQFTCGPTEVCPSGFSCASDGHCRRGAGSVDSAGLDGGAVDAAADAWAPGPVGAECGSDADCETGLSCYADEFAVLRCHCEPYANVGCGSGEACYFRVYLVGPPVVLQARCHSVGAGPRGDTSCGVDDDSACAPMYTCAPSTGCQPLCRDAECDAVGCHRFGSTTTPAGYGWCDPI